MVMALVAFSCVWFGDGRRKNYQVLLFKTVWLTHRFCKSKVNFTVKVMVYNTHTLFRICAIAVALFPDFLILMLQKHYSITRKHTHSHTHTFLDHDCGCLITWSYGNHLSIEVIEPVLIWTGSLVLRIGFIHEDLYAEI